MLAQLWMLRLDPEPGCTVGLYVTRGCVEQSRVLFCGA